jgi:antitoxin ParD1/3/4
LRFSAYLPPELACWLLGLVEKGIFLDPSEAVFVILGEHQELESHADLRRELLSRMLQAAMDDPRPSIPAEEVFKKLKEKRGTLREAAEWKK